MTQCVEFVYAYLMLKKKMHGLPISRSVNRLYGVPNPMCSLWLDHGSLLTRVQAAIVTVVTDHPGEV